MDSTLSLQSNLYPHVTPAGAYYAEYYRLHIMKQPVLKIYLLGLKQTMRIQH